MARRSKPRGRWIPPNVTILVAACAVILIFAATTNAGCSSSAQEKTSIRVLFAGSLIVPFEQLEREFEAAYPNIDVNMEGHGSIQVIRLVSDLKEQADVLVTADYKLIPMLLYTTQDPDSGSAYADWYAIFATNEMTLAYTPQSAFAAEIDQTNWIDIIDRPGVRLGCADPRLDASGYRALMTIKLAEHVYDRPKLFSDTFGGKFRVPIRVSEEGGVTLIKVPEVLETKSGSSLVLRPYSVQLLPLLKSGDIDYAFEYESVAKQHGLAYITLPPGINLGDAAFASAYASVVVKLDFQRFATVKPEFAGEPIRYGVTIPSNAGDQDAAATFVAFLLGPEGQRIMAENSQPMISPALADNLEALPEPIKALCTPVD
jgi:molybdate/tungstate transport system substrate-binding protein